jgi:hypothetical protein
MKTILAFVALAALGLAQAPPPCPPLCPPPDQGGKKAPKKKTNDTQKPQASLQSVK